VKDWQYRWRSIHGKSLSRTVRCHLVGLLYREGEVEQSVAGEEEGVMEMV